MSKYKDLVEKVDKLDKIVDDGKGFLDEKRYSDVGAGIVVPTKDVIRGIQRMHEAKEPFFERLVKILALVNTALLVIVLVLK